MTAPALARTPARLDGENRRVDWASAVSISMVSATIVMQLAAGSTLRSVQVGVLVVGLLAGLPHGATDHVIAARLMRRPIALITAGYALIAVAAYIAFRSWPLPALACFAIVSAAHFASGETQFANNRRPGVDVSTFGRLTTQSAIGATIIVFPIALHPTESSRLLAALPGRLDVVGLEHTAASSGWLWALGIGLVIGAALTMLLRRRRWFDALDVALLAVLFAFVTPLVAFGVYFGAWHSVRHIGRLIDQTGTGQPAGSLSASHLTRFAHQAALPTVGALVAVGWLRWHSDGWLAFISSDIAVLAGLTMPHLVVVALSDRASRAAGAAGWGGVVDRRWVRARRASAIPHR